MSSEFERADSEKRGFMNEDVSEAQRNGVTPASPLSPRATREDDDQNIADISKVLPWVETEPQKVFRVVLTGGPCAGKTTSLGVLKKHFQSLGYRVYFVPEVATIAFTSGVVRTDLHNDEAVFHFQATLIKLLIALEDAFYALALHTGEKCVIFCDRGTLDGSAYVEKPVWQAILDENGWTNVALRDKRYDCVVHMVSAAIGAPSFYNRENLARSESPEEAAQMDMRLRNAWLGHPYLVVIDNTTDFEEKLRRVVDVVTRRIHEGKKESTYRKRKFLIDSASIPDSSFPVECEDFYVTYDKLLTRDKDCMASIRKRGQLGSYTYTLIVRKGHGVERRRTLTVSEYLTLLQHKDPQRSTVVQKRRYFIWKENVFHLDWFRKPEAVSQMVFAQAYMSQALDSTSVLNLLPPWLKVVREVSNIPDYSLSRYSQGGNVYDF